MFPTIETKVEPSRDPRPQPVEISVNGGRVTNIRLTKEGLPLFTYDQLKQVIGKYVFDKPHIVTELPKDVTIEDYNENYVVADGDHPQVENTHPLIVLKVRRKSTPSS